MFDSQTAAGTGVADSESVAVDTELVEVDHTVVEAASLSEETELDSLGEDFALISCPLSPPGLSLKKNPDGTTFLQDFYQ